MNPARPVQIVGKTVRSSHHPDQPCLRQHPGQQRCRCDPAAPCCWTQHCHQSPLCHLRRAWGDRVLKKSPKLIRIWAVGLLFFSAWFVAIFSLTEIAKDFLGNDYYSTGAVTYGVQFTILNILALMDLEDDHDQVIHQNAR